MVFIELTAAIVAVSSIFKYSSFFKRPERVLVFYLCFAVFSEFLGLYPHYLYKSGLVNSEFYLNNPHLIRAYWWFNIYTITAALCFGYYFYRQLERSSFRKLAKGLLFTFLITTVVNILFTDVFFKKYSIYTDVSSVVILVSIISFYYYELLSSDKILHLNKSFTFLLSIPIFLYYIVITPLFLLSSNYIKSEPVFMDFYNNVRDSCNFFLYGMFIFGYLWCYWFNKSLNKKSSSLSTF